MELKLKGLNKIVLKEKLGKVIFLVAFLIICLFFYLYLTRTNWQPIKDAEIGVVVKRIYLNSRSGGYNECLLQLQRSREKILAECNGYCLVDDVVQITKRESAFGKPYYRVVDCKVNSDHDGRPRIYRGEVAR